MVQRKNSQPQIHSQLQENGQFIRLSVIQCKKLLLLMTKAPQVSGRTENLG